MTGYIQATNFTAKDNLTTGDANKRIMGSTVDAELALISAAIASKANTSDVVAVTGGTFTGNVTVAKASGSTTLTVDAADDAVLVLDKAASGDTAYIRGSTGGTKRWEVEFGNATTEAGSDAGSNFVIAGYTDAGALVGAGVTITRSTLDIAATGQLSVSPVKTDPAHAIVATAKGDNATPYFGVVGYADTGHTLGGGVEGVASDSTTYGICGYREAGGTAYSFVGNASALLSAGSWGTSDKRVKSDLQRIDNALDKLGTLTGYTFTRIDLNNERRTGLIAQDVQAVLPEAVTEGPDGLLALNSGDVLGLVVEAIKELRAEIELIKGRL